CRTRGNGGGSFRGHYLDSTMVPGGPGGYGGYETRCQLSAVSLKPLRLEVLAESRELTAESLLNKFRGPAGQAFDAFCDRRVSRKQAAEAHPEERLDNEQVRG